MLVLGWRIVARDTRSTRSLCAWCGGQNAYTPEYGRINGPTHGEPAPRTSPPPPETALADLNDE